MRSVQAVAFGKLQGILDSKPLALPGKNYINWWAAANNLGECICEHLETYAPSLFECHAL